MTHFLLVIGAFAASERLALYRPQRDHPLTGAIIAGNVAAFALVSQREELFAALAKSNAALGRGQLYRLVSSCLLHAGPAHLMVSALKAGRRAGGVATRLAIPRWSLVTRPRATPTTHRSSSTE